MDNLFQPILTNTLKFHPCCRNWSNGVTKEDVLFEHVGRFNYKTGPGWVITEPCVWRDTY